ncbi:MAG: multicopper oxidase domain-containing protein [Chloroflexi bacterium]|nr:multicopper oxidase domain-containing protein [Chloroflexota bacterium]
MAGDKGLGKGKTSGISRRNLLKTGAVSAGVLVGGGLLSQAMHAQETHPADQHHAAADPAAHSEHNSLLVGVVDHQRNGFDPMQVLVDWDAGQVSVLPNGQTLREYNIYAEDKEIEIAPGIFYPAWTYNGRVPGPTIRCTEGDRLRIRFINGGTHPHTLHFHGIHPFEMDGVPGAGPGEIAPGQTFTYEFDADPFGCFLYHCHAMPLKRHIHKGLYGAFIVDPKQGRPPAREFVMVMNGFDTNFDEENEVYAVNTVGHEYVRRPIPAKVGELIRVYLINIVEFDPLNSFHLHANMFDYYDHGTTLEPTLRTVDTIMQVQGQRGILEFKYRWPGKYMFHAHVSEFTELGWMGQFNVVPPDQFEAAMAEVGVDAEWDRKATQGSTAKANA